MDCEVVCQSTISGHQQHLGYREDHGCTCGALPLSLSLSTTHKGGTQALRDTYIMDHTIANIRKDVTSKRTYDRDGDFLMETAKGE